LGAPILVSSNQAATFRGPGLTSVYEKLGEL
jgi:hypothetical protein